MKKNTNLNPLYLSSINNTQINTSPYRQNTSNIFINQNSFLLKTKKNLNSNLIDNNQKRIYYNTINQSYNNDEILKKNKNTNKITKFTQNSKNEEKIFLPIRKETVFDSNIKDKINDKVFNGKQNLIKNNYNIVKKKKNRNNHSFLESKYILKNGSSLLTNLKENNAKNNRISNNTNNENINLSNILPNKNLTIKNIDLNKQPNLNKKNLLIDYSSPKFKSQTFYNSVNQNDQNATSSIDYQNISINRSKHNIIKIINHNKNKEINNKFTYINNQNGMINSSKSLNRIDINKINSNNIKNNEKTSNKIKFIETNKEPNSVFKHLSSYPKTERKKNDFNSHFSLEFLSNKNEDLKINEKSEHIAFKNLNIYQKNATKNPFQKCTSKYNRILINNRLNKTNISDKMNNFFQSKINEERKSENLKLNKNFIDESKNYVQSPRFSDCMTINRNNKSYFVENKNKSVKIFSSINSSLFSKSNNNIKNSINIAFKKNNNSININANAYNAINSNNRKTKLEEKVHLISSKKYEVGIKTLQPQKNKKNLDSINILKKSSFQKLDKKINYIKSCSSISISGENEEGFKKLNQDSYLIQRNINGIINFNIFGVLDGHGDDGHYASQFVSRFIINCVKNNTTIKKCSTANEIYDKIKMNNYKLIEKIFLDADMQIRREKFDYRTSGTTCVIIFQLGQKIICANVGDSRAIIVHSKTVDLKDSKVFPLSNDCKPNLPKERKRIYECGGTVEKSLDENGQEEGPFRVYEKGKDYPGLAMSRCIGDIDSKKIGIIPNPEIIEYNINDETKYMIIGSDGIWEFMDNEEVMEIANEYYLNNDVKGLCKCLYETSVDYWNEADYYLDDITAIAVFF